MINKILVFKNSGWCEKLKMSYEKGRYQPKNEHEFEELRKFASEVFEIKPEPSIEKVLNENQIVENTSAKNETNKIEVKQTAKSESEEVKKDFTDVEISDLRAKAKEAKIHNWHSKNPNTLIKELDIEQ